MDLTKYMFQYLFTGQKEDKPRYDSHDSPTLGSKRGGGRLLIFGESSQPRTLFWTPCLNHFQVILHSFSLKCSCFLSF